MIECATLSGLACVAGVQRGGRGEVESEREARSLGAQRSRFALALNFPLPPLCTPTTQAISGHTYVKLFTEGVRGTVPVTRTNFLKAVLAIDVRCCQELTGCGTVYLSTCGKHKLSLALNPAAAVSFLARINVNINNTRH